jgi:hypothetical protein
MKNLAIKYGLFMFAGFAALFFILYIFGAAEYANLRSLNVFIHFGLMYVLIREYRRAYPETVNNYVKGTIVGMAASMIGAFAFAALVFFTLKLDPVLLGELKSRSPLPEYFTPLNAASFLTVEGTVVGLIGAYIVTRIVDARYDHTPSEGKVSKAMTSNSTH